jgi:hypothetical protein
VFDRCRTEEPELKPTTGMHMAACHLHDGGPAADAAATQAAGANARQTVAAT